MLRVKIMKIDKNGHTIFRTLKLRNDNTTNKRLEELAEIAQDCYIDQEESWR